MSLRRYLMRDRIGGIEIYKKKKKPAGHGHSIGLTRILALVSHPLLG
jgi:hypothetical protein